MKLKINEESESAGAGEWMTTYSDMVTLLLTFFVLLFAISNVDAMKFSILAKALSSDGITAEELVDIQIEYGMIGPGIYDLEDPKFPGPGNSDIEPNDLVNTGEEANEEEMDEWLQYLNELHSLIGTYIEENNLGDSIFLHEGEGDGSDLLISLTSDVWFDSGSAEVNADMYGVAATLGQLLRDTYREAQPFDIIVSGHTDNVPMNTSRYPDNWELSLDRAGRFMRILMEESGISPQYFSARGYGEEAPIDTNDTPEGRQKNRRVEVLISHAKKQSEMILSLNNAKEVSDALNDAEGLTEETQTNGEDGTDETAETTPEELNEQNGANRIN